MQHFLFEKFKFIYLSVYQQATFGPCDSNYITAKTLSSISSRCYAWG